MIGLGGQLGGPGEQEITGQDGRGGRPARIQGWHAAPEQRAVDQVIVDQGGGVQQFHGCAEGDQFFLGRSQHVSDQQTQGGPNPFPSGSQ